MMAASNLEDAFRIDRRWTSESASTPSSATSASTAKGTAHARSASRSAGTTSFRSSTTATGGSRRSAQKTASAESDSKTKYMHSSSPAASTAAPSSRSLGPSSIPTGRPHPGHDTTADASNAGLTSGARTAIIVATVIGGLLILALLIVLLFRWRRTTRQAPKSADIPYLRPPSTTTFLSTKTRDANLTALPTYRERRKRLAEAANRQARILPDMQELYRHDPRHQDLWKTANPPTPVVDRFPAENQNERGDIQPRPPEMAHTRGISPVVRLSSPDDANLGPVESIYAPSAIDLETGMWPPTPYSEDTLRDRWSWSTSYATAKSKVGAQSLTSTIGSLPGVRRVREWIANSPVQQREPPLIREGDPGPSRANSVTFLKNKATKPNLAPMPTGDLSGWQIEPESGSPTNASNALPAHRKGSNGGLEAIDAVLPEDGVIS